jgi:undecaprenyl diphosphate synthase
MDGNGRWAERRGLPVADGHREGTRALRRTVEAAIDLGVVSLASTPSRPRTGRGRPTRSTR